MRLRISHSTTYRYEPPASAVIQVLRMTPGSHDGQYVADWQIDVSTDSRLDMHQDAFGNVTHVLTHGPIAELVIRAEGLIETHDTGGVLRGIHLRIAGRLLRLLRSAGAEGVVAVTGGLGQDVGLVASLRELLEKESTKSKKPLPKLEVRMHPQAMLAGALGAAMLGAYRYDQLQRKKQSSAHG